jgi:serine/threonine protein kinase
LFAVICQDNEALLSLDLANNSIPAELELEIVKVLEMNNKIAMKGMAVKEEAAKEMNLQQWQVPSSAIVDLKVLSREGSFGDVHLVRCRELKMAFKTIRTGGSKAAQTQVRAALKEAYTLKEAWHENIIRLEGICIDDPQHLGVLMEYAEQGTLRQVLDANPEMANKKRQLLIRGILRGLAKLHSHTPKPILHGDLKATNVLVMANGVPKLADFGQASGASSGAMASVSMSKTHRGGGTPIYSAPELFAHLFQKVDLDSDSDSEDAAEALVVQQYTKKCDMYSLGVLIWEVETTQVPWAVEIAKWSKKIAGAGTGNDQIKQQLATTVFEKRKRPKFPANCTPLIRSIIERCWHHEAEQRPPVQIVLDELETEIDAIVGHEASAAAAASIMADDYAVPDAPSYALSNFASSNFKREYEWTATKPLAAPHTDRLLGAVRRVIEGYCGRHNIDQVRGDNFFLELRREWKLTDDVSIAAERLWTSLQTMRTGTGREPEFCFVLSQLLRDDPASLARSCAIIARALNTNLVAGRTSSVIFPANGQCWRGGGFDEQHRSFFTVGKKYRVPGFLATSLQKNVTQTFMFRAEAAGYPVVQWCIQLDSRSDPHGENSLQHRCKHVNLIRVTHVPGEEEYLFAAFSVFTVSEAVWSANPTVQTPHRITIKAAIDNSLEVEDLPLAPWS